MPPGAKKLYRDTSCFRALELPEEAGWEAEGTESL